MKSVLVVDDEFDLTMTLKAVLELRGYSTRTCSTGAEAWACIQQSKPDLVLLDVMLPMGTGYTVLEKLRQSTEFVATPVVLMNPVALPAERAEGCTAFLKKPLSLPRVLETVEALIGEPQ